MNASDSSSGLNAGADRMGNKEWPDDWKVGNSSARLTLGCMVLPFAAIGLGVLIRWGWPYVSRLLGGG